MPLPAFVFCLNQQSMRCRFAGMSSDQRRTEVREYWSFRLSGGDQQDWQSDQH